MALEEKPGPHQRDWDHLGSLNLCLFDSSISTNGVDRPSDINICARLKPSWHKSKQKTCLSAEHAFYEDLLDFLSSTKSKDLRLSAVLLKSDLALMNKIEHSRLLGSFGLLVQMDENVSGLVLLS